MAGSKLSTGKIVGIIVNDKVIYALKDYIEKVNNYLFKVNINSFFQVNLNILEKTPDITQKELSAQTGLNNATISRMLNVARSGRQYKSTIDKIAKAIDDPELIKE